MIKSKKEILEKCVEAALDFCTFRDWGDDEVYRAICREARGSFQTGLWVLEDEISDDDVRFIERAAELAHEPRLEDITYGLNVEEVGHVTDHVIDKIVDLVMNATHLDCEEKCGVVQELIEGLIKENARQHNVTTSGLKS